MGHNISKESFLKRYDISKEKFNKTGLNWEDLKAIYEDYLEYKEELVEPAELIFKTLMKAEKVHSVRYRIKNPEHLIEKIIRKKIEKGENSNITIENYKTELTDLIGIRALHLYKNDWIHIDNHIKSSWELNEDVVANYRIGDSKEYIRQFEEKGLHPKEHKYGYRSIHYIVKTKPFKKQIFAEIQVRTVFEEGWAEIDHTVRYPYDKDNEIYNKFLSILNRLSGNADEMGSFVLELRSHLTSREEEHAKQVEKQSNIILNLEKQLEEANIQGEENESLKKTIEELRAQNQSVNNFNPLDNMLTDTRISSISSGLESFSTFSTENLPSLLGESYSPTLNSDTPEIDLLKGNLSLDSALESKEEDEE